MIEIDEDKKRKGKFKKLKIKKLQIITKIN